MVADANSLAATWVLGSSHSGNTWLAASTNPSDCVFQGTRREWLEEDVHVFGAVPNGVGFRIARNDQRGHLRTDPACAPDELGPGEMRHRIVANDEIAFARAVVQSGQGLSAV